MPRPKRISDRVDAATTDSLATHFWANPRDIPSCEPAFFAHFNGRFVRFDSSDVKADEYLAFLDVILGNNWTNNSCRFDQALAIVSAQCHANLPSIFAGMEKVNRRFPAKHGYRALTRELDRERKRPEPPVVSTIRDVSALDPSKPRGHRFNAPDLRLGLAARPAVPERAEFLLRTLVEGERWGECYVLLFFSFIAAQPYALRKPGLPFSTSVANLIEYLRGPFLAFHGAMHAHTFESVLSHLRGDGTVVYGYDEDTLFPSSLSVYELSFTCSSAAYGALCVVHDLAVTVAYAMFDGFVARRLSKDSGRQGEFKKDLMQVLTDLSRKHQYPSGGRLVQRFGKSQFVRIVRHFSGMTKNFTAYKSELNVTTGVDK